MAIIELRKDETVGIIVLNNGENRHNPDFVRELLKAFDDIEADENMKATVITSSDKKNWSLGIDLTWMMGCVGTQKFQEIKDFMYGLDKIYKRIMTFPMPVIAAINGHAFGNGAITACSCDFRFMKADRGFFCFPEVDIDIPLMPGMVEVVRQAVPYHKLKEMVYLGKRCSAKELEAEHVIVKACENEEELMKDALAFARTFNKKRPIFAEIKRRFFKESFVIMDTEDPVLIEALKISI